jgi:hypothetical protein
MLKRDEITNPNSCWNKAREDERLFILLDRDDAMADTIQFWINKRIELGKNKPGDPKLVEAEECIRLMASERATREAMSHKLLKEGGRQVMATIQERREEHEKRFPNTTVVDICFMVRDFTRGDSCHGADWFLVAIRFLKMVDETWMQPVPEDMEFDSSVRRLVKAAIGYAPPGGRTNG